MFAFVICDPIAGGGAGCPQCGGGRNVLTVLCGTRDQWAPKTSENIGTLSMQTGPPGPGSDTTFLSVTRLDHNNNLLAAGPIFIIH